MTPSYEMTTLVEITKSNLEANPRSQVKHKVVPYIARLDVKHNV